MHEFLMRETVKHKPIHVCFLIDRHAACPVIVGSKWVANKWIHEAGNEFTRPCGLEIDHDIEF